MGETRVGRFTRGARQIAAAALAVGVLLTAPAPAVAQTPDYTELATRFRAAHSLEALPTDASALPQALDRLFVTLDLGLFELRYPAASLADPKRGDEFREIALALLDLQLKWRGWLDVTRADPPPPADAAAVRSWIKGWRGDALKKAMAARAADAPFAVAAGANAAQQAALASCAESFRKGGALDLPLEGTSTRLVLAPSREMFIGLVAFVGTLQADWKPLAWSANLAQRSAFQLNELLLLALSHPAPDGSPAGIGMNTREPTGLLQHVTQYAADRVVKHSCGATLDPGFHLSLSVGLVIELFGENNARLFNSGEGKTIPARERFVPGGRSEGGKLAARSADPRWRFEKGRDWFLKQLKLAQAEGNKIAIDVGETAPSPLSHFVLDANDKPNVKDIATAPLLGAYAAAQQVPANFYADYQECLRAYRTCFLHWLMEEAKPLAGGKRGVAQLLRARLTRPAEPFDALCTELYGVPLTAPEPASKALEWQFLAWLNRVRA